MFSFAFPSDDPRPRALIVASNALHRKALQDAVEQHGMAPIAPPTLGSGLSHAHRVGVVVAYLDGDPKAVQLCAEIRRRHTRLPLMVALPDPAGDTLRLGAEVGADDFFRYPVCAEELAARLKSRTTGREAAEELVRTTAKYRALVEGSRAGLFVLRDGWFSYANARTVELLGHASEALRTQTLQGLVVPEERGEVERRLLQWTMGSEPALRLGTRVVHRDGGVVPVEVHLTRGAVDGAPVLIGTIFGIGRRRKAQELLHASDEYFRALIERALDVITVIAPDGTILYESPSVEGALGYRAEELIGQNIFDLVHRDDQARARSTLSRILQTPGVAMTIRCRIRSRDGSWRVYEAMGRDLLDSPVVGGIVINSRDITEQQAAEDALRAAAFTDPLTGLANRTLFAERVAHAITRCNRDPDARFALIYLDLDRFKVVNDSLGHDVGDRLLAAVATRLRAEVHDPDTVARFGGDEFALLLETVAGEDEATAVARRLHEALALPFDLDGHEVFIAASMGIVVGSPGDPDPEHLLRNADMAMYRAKAAGGGEYAHFDCAMHGEALLRLQVETDLRRAVERGELRLHYQPIVELPTGRVAGFEALVRWQHPERGLVPPTSFIGIAEETGHIVPIGQWVLQTACRELRRLQEVSGDPELFISVNLSSRQLRQTDLLERVREALDSAGIRGRHLKLEITESMVVENTCRVSQTLQQLRDLGIQLYMDDFGTGYASLSYLHRLPLDGIKIDRSFVSGMHDDPRHALLVRSLVTLARGFGLQVVAEGIEEEIHTRMLAEPGCRFGQGYLFSRPVEHAAAAALLLGKTDASATAYAANTTGTSR